MLISSLYATSPRTCSPRPVRVPSDQNIRWRLPFHYVHPLIKDKKSLSTPFFLILPGYQYSRIWEWIFRYDTAYVWHWRWLTMALPAVATGRNELLLLVEAKLVSTIVGGCLTLPKQWRREAGFIARGRTLFFSRQSQGLLFSFFFFLIFFSLFFLFFFASSFFSLFLFFCPLPPTLVRGGIYI